MQEGRKAVWSIPYISVAFFPSLKHNFIAYHSSSRSDCISENHQQWQSGFSWCNILTNKREITSDATGVTAPTTSGGFGQ